MKSYGVHTYIKITVKL